MEPLQLVDLRSADSNRLAQARRHIHNAALWPARIANSYRPAETGQHHLHLLWSFQDQALSSESFNDGLTVQLRLPALHLQFMKAGRPVPHVFDMEDRSPAEAEAWILVELLHRGIAREQFSKTLPFEIAAPMTGDSEKYTPVELEAELSALTAWIASAASILQSFAQSQGRNGSVCLDPELFHFSVAADAPAAPGATTSIRIGFALGDARQTGPFFYLVPQSNGTVKGLRPDAVLSVQTINEDAMSADAICTFLHEAAFQKAG